jgi:2-phosphosulfolactate phosphatase
MKIDVLWTPSEIEQIPVQERTAVVVDVLRSGTSVATAIHNGARAVLPAGSIEEAMRIANSLGRRDVLLCGERQGVRIDGFDLGNSPAEFGRETVGDRTLVMTTTNGTQALAALSTARAVYVAALVNLSAVAGVLRETAGDTLIVCAGRRGRVSIEDALCAGLLIEVLLKRERRKGSARATVDLGDGAIAALALAHEHGPVDAEFLRRCEAGRALEEIGQGSDIEICAGIDSIPDVPALRDRQIVRLEATRGPGGGGRKVR